MKSVHVGRRVAQLRESHGESLRQAAVRTGVSHTTIARIERGDVSGSFETTLRKIAEGYGVPVEFLLAGRDLREEFHVSLRRLPPQQRARLYFAPQRERIRMVLQFLQSEYPAEFPVSHLAEAAGCEVHLLDQLLADGAPAIPAEVERHIAQSLARMTGVPQHWFHSGESRPEGQEMPSDSVNAFVRLMRKAARAGIVPEVLDMAIDLLILKSRDGTGPSSSA